MCLNKIIKESNVRYLKKNTCKVRQQIHKVLIIHILISRQVDENFGRCDRNEYNKNLLVFGMHYCISATKGNCEY